MTVRTSTINTLYEYFSLQEGGTLNERDYKAKTDTPIRYAILKRMFHNWARLQNMVAKSPLALQATPPAVASKVDPVKTK